jgi:hypothetical protein
MSFHFACLSLLLITRPSVLWRLGCTYRTVRVAPVLIDAQGNQTEYLLRDRSWTSHPASERVPVGN